MSFSAEVKKELMPVLPDARHCMLAALAAAMQFHAVWPDEGGPPVWKLQTENRELLKKYFTILRNAFRIDHVDVASDGHGIWIPREDLSLQVYQALKWWDGAGIRRRASADERLLSKECCRRIFVRTCFEAGGSVIDPDKFYHMEFACHTEELAGQICLLLGDYGLDPRTIRRKKYYVVYLKESGQISDCLKLIGASRSVLKFEGTAVVKDLRNQVNRQVNCETANLNKISQASVRQMEAIRRIEHFAGLSSLPEPLYEAARARMEAPEASLVELGERLAPPVGKSGMNHRFRKLLEMAEKYPPLSREDGPGGRQGS